MSILLGGRRAMHVAGLVWGKELFIDSTDVDANASIDSLQPRFGVEVHLARLFHE